MTDFGCVHRRSSRGPVVTTTACLILAVTGFGLLGPLAPPAAAGRPGPRLIALGSLGGPGSNPIDINDHGQVVGNSTTANGTQRAFLWERGAMRELTVPGETHDIWARAINDHGDVAGTIVRGFRDTTAVVWTGGQVSVLPTLGGATVAHAINDRGQVAGTAVDPDGNTHAVLWDAGALRDIDVIPPFDDQVLLNNHGQVAFSHSGHAYLWDDGRISDAGTGFPGDPQASARAWDLADDGTVLAWSSTRTPDNIAVNAGFVWRRGRSTVLPVAIVQPSPCGMYGHLNNRGVSVGPLPVGSECHAALRTTRQVVDLGTLGGRSSLGFALNDHGTVIGWSDTADGLSRAFRWSRGAMNDLGVLPGDTDSSPGAINERGQIVGSSYNRYSDVFTTHGFLFDPGPAPG